MTDGNNVSPSARRKARHYAVQGLYQWKMSGNSVNIIEASFRTEYDMKNVDVAYFHEILHQVPARLDEVQAIYSPHLQDRNDEELDPVTEAVLRLACYELKYRIDVPYKVVINEAVALSKKFGATDSHKFVNGVLDRAAEQTRGLEVSANRNKR
ncbi:transcription antitermination factor NusB [Gilvimarinus agarilyticus]|uniref:transcription antitermination factor NusB n=1 Tax=unclassified Gilvimarinus TaxID=2642066 RepID=UPI001C09B0D2|nr:MULTISPECIES: transcription antitermination factor NusB [unclassified Gilvimarinus]MBU2885771.1 transcription antitermination factor NusB [Gilvimarinus agarilyticus]MDO6570624.1 transcription antitermination factor NusB [Gilvimarinus sp. 2_MG-2023]MDO6746199.1 transcription antitermination factor NusB [Gilvimarinus sp. 1_MG-2023]